MTDAHRAVFAALVCAAAALAPCGCARQRGSERVEWTSMGTIAAVQARGAADARILSAEVRGVFAEVESLLNAHDVASEIRKLAALPDDGVVKACSEAVRPCYKAAFMLQKATGGAFNPRWRGAGTLDLGAIAKGFAVDLAAGRVAVPEGGAALVDLGGNVKAVKGSWRTGVRDPGGNGFAASVELREGEALATSATYFRGNHIYDGRTGRPADVGVASVTVLCRSAMLADGLSTALFVLGPEEGRAFLAARLDSLGCGGEVAVLWLLRDGSAVAFDRDGRFRR